MSALLDAIRQKYPQYADTPDDDLALAIGRKYPTYLDSDKDFNQEFADAKETQREKIVAGAPRIRPDAEKMAIPRVFRTTTALPKAVVADIAAGFAGKPEFSGNIPAAISDQPLPVEQALTEAAKESKFRGEDPVSSVTGRIALGIAGTAPMIPLLGALPAAGKEAALIAFTTKMVSDTPEIARQLGEEFGKPPEQRDPDKISKLVSSAIQTVGFAAAGGVGVKRGMTAPPRPEFTGPLATGAVMRMPEGAKPSLTPLTDEAVKQTVTQKEGVPNAVQERSAEKVPVATSPGGGEKVGEGTPTSKEAAVSQEQSKEKVVAKNIQSIRPAIKMMDGKFVVGQKFDVHEDIINRHGLDAKDMDSRTFVDENGNEVSREELEQMGVKSDKPVEGAHASDLAKVQMTQAGFHIDNILKMTPDEFVKWKTDNQWGPKISQAISETMGPEHVDQAQAQMEDLRGQANDLNQDLNEALAQGETSKADNIMKKAGEISVKAQSINEILQDHEANKTAQPEMIGMGGAKDGEVAGEGNPDIYGVAERVREQRAAADQVGAVPPGEGISAPDSVERGRDLLDKGADPEKAMKDFEVTKKLSSDDMAVARAHGERLAQTARAVEEQFGTESDEFRRTQKNLTDWDNRSKAMQTEWHKTGMAQQGETDIDTGSFSGLQRAFTETTEKEFNQPQTARAKQLADRVKSGEQASIKAMKKLNDELHRATEAAKATAPRIHPKILEIANKIVEGLDKRADAARARIRERSTRLAAGVDPTVILDLAEIGASHIAHLTMDFAEWSAKMTEELGDWVKPHLQEVFDKSQKIISGLNTNEAVKRAIRSPKERAPKTVEAKALADAQKEVRNAAVKAADAEKKARVAKAGPERQQGREKADAEKRALQAAQKTVREAAARAAKAATTERVKVAAETPEAIQDKAAQDALKAANEVAKRAAKDAADAEQKQRDAKSKRERSTADIQRKAAQKALDAANKRVKDAAAKAAEAERKNQAEPERKVWEKVKDYLDKGEISFDDIRHKVATDLGMTVKKVTDLLTLNKRAKYLAEDAWRKQQNLRRFKQVAKRWVTEQSIPGFQRAIQRIPRYLFALKVGFHGTVALGTHAPMVLFQPKFWGEYFTNYGKMYRMVKSPSYYEMQVQDLLRRPNYITARRAGLVNDPYTFEDFNSPDMAQYIGRISGMGNRGYAVLKLLRQDMFDQQWNDLPKTQQIPEVAQALADGIDHATGVVKVNAPKGANVALFAPRLLASRAAWLVGDPARAAKAFADWKNAPPGEKQFAINQVKEKAWVVGTAMTMLAINQGILSAVGSKQKVNMTDPTRSDFMKFKVVGMNFSYGNAMLSMARLPLRLYSNVKNEGKLNKVIYEDENVAKTAFDFARSQASPTASLALDLGLGRDFEERPLPRKAFGLLPGDTNVPKRLKAQGVEPYTWAEFVTEAALPIPGEEAAREVWREHFKMDPHYVKAAFKALATVSVMGATGGRLTEDTEPQQ